MPPKPERPKLTGEAQMLHDVFNGSAIKGDALKAARKILGESSKEDDKSSRWDLQAFLNHLNRLQSVVTKAREKGKDATAKRLIKSLVDSICQEELGLDPISEDSTDSNDLPRYLENQKARITEWVYYLAEPDSVYPVWFKFYAVRSIITLRNNLSYTEDQDGNHTNHHYKKRENKTTTSYPELNREALAKTFAEISSSLLSQRKYASMPSHKDSNHIIKDIYKTSEKQPTEAAKKQFEVSFNRVYARFMDQLGGIQDKEKENIKGRWVLYQDGDSEKLTESLQGFNTGWCIADIGTSKDYLKNGKIHVYYSLIPDEPDSRLVPRLCIRYQRDVIKEIRGIEPAQGVENITLPILETRLIELGDKKGYLKTAQYQKYITSVINKTSLKQDLTIEELKALWCIGYTVDEQNGFGYSYEESGGKNELVNKVIFIRNNRNKHDDLKKIFEHENSRMQKIYVDFEDKLEEIELFSGEDIAMLLKEFDIPHSYIAYRILELGHINAVVDNFEKFDGVDQKTIVDLIINSDFADEIIKIKESLKEVSDNYIAKRLLDTGNEAIISEDTGSFKNLSVEIADRLFLVGEGTCVASNIESFVGINEKYVLSRLMDFDVYHEFVAININLFKNEYHNSIALQLIESGSADLVIENYDKFKDLDESTIKKLEEYRLQYQ